ncbi:MAG: NYN domain-containing protein [Burkholderiales bacterium]|nr:NYN domain-containing protein [Burkholderiales bacterium]
MCRNHIKNLTGTNDPRWQQHVYRIFFYDAVPYDGKAHHPIDNRPIDFAKSDVAHQRYALFDLLRKERKLALRLGKVTRDHDWTISPALTKKLLRTRQAVGALDRLGELPADAAAAIPVSLQLSADEARSLMMMRDLWHSLDGGSVSLGLRQKGVDMRIGIDISSLTLKKQVDTIILVAGDSDFVPAAKLARREGIEFILDPLWQKVNPDLFEHIDGLQSGLKRPGGATPAPGVAAATDPQAHSGQQDN